MHPVWRVQFDKQISVKEKHMIERNKLDLWYDRKYPLYDLSSNGICPNPEYVSLMVENLSNTNMFELCEYYGDTNGNEALISSLCQKYNCDTDNILITNGASEALYIVLQVFANQNCDIVYQIPYYQNLDSLILQIGNSPIRYHLDANDNFEFSIDHFKRNITADTELVILNFPNNPTGAILQDNDYKKIIDLASIYNFKILFDEVSIEIAYQNQCYFIEKNITKTLEHTICINSMSKAFGFAGLRIGWIVADDSFIRHCQIIKESLSVSSAPLSQFIANELLKKQDYMLKNNIKQVKDNLNFLLLKSNSLNNYLSVIIPKGGACCLIEILIDIDVDQFCTDLYNSKSILVAPGSVFGYKNCIRLGLGAENTIFRTAIEIFLDFIVKYKNTTNEC